MSARPGVFGSLRTTLEMIKFSHTLFALPFALYAAFLAAGGWPAPATLGKILLAMVGARSAAMAHNRLADRRIDAANPRTASRALPSGALSVGFVQVFLAASVALFVAAAASLNRLTFLLSPVALALLFLYSYTKRFTALSHFVLGLCLALAPVGAWIAVRGSVEWLPILLGLAVLFWTAGFDVIYSLQDEEFDRSAGLRSIPARLGARRALVVSALLHARDGGAARRDLEALGRRRDLPRRDRRHARGARLPARDRPAGRSVPRRRGFLHRQRLRVGDALPVRHRPGADAGDAVSAQTLITRRTP